MLKALIAMVAILGLLARSWRPGPDPSIHSPWLDVKDERVDGYWSEWTRTQELICNTN